MAESDGWLYLGEYSVYSTEYRVTIPPCVFDQYGIFTRDSLAWWIYEEGMDGFKLCNKGPDKEVDFSNFNTISDSGDDNPAAFITLPEKIRREGYKQAATENELDTSAIPHRLTLPHNQTLHFVTKPSLTRGDQKGLYIFTLENLEKIIEESKGWVEDPRSLSRLMDSSASHLLDSAAELLDRARDNVQSAGDGDEAKGDAIEVGEKSLAERLQISQNSVPEDFEIQNRQVEIRGIPPHIYEWVDLNYLLVRYGVSKRIRNTPSENHELVANLNKDVDVETTYREEEEQKILASVPFCLHNRHSLRFKFFVTVLDSDMLEVVRECFAESPSCASASISDSLRPRVYMVHNEFRTAKTDRGFINNVIYPK